MDGHALAFRAYYALPELNAPDGTPTNAVLGFLNMLLKVINDEKPDRVVIFLMQRARPFDTRHMKSTKKEGRQHQRNLKRKYPYLKSL